MQTAKKTIGVLSKVKQIMELDCADAVNEYLATEEWVLIDIRNSRFAPRVYVIGKVRMNEKS